MSLLFSNMSEIILSTENVASDKILLALHELNRGLRELGFSGSIGETRTSNSNALLITLSAKQSQSENYAITFNHSETPHIRLNAESEQSLLYAVFDFLEHQGVFFGLDGAINLIDPITHLTVPGDGQSWTGKPLFANRGLQPWPDFLNCITTFNEEDLRAYLEAMLRMRFNTLGIHVYGQSNKWVEPFLSFEYGGVGHAAFADTTATDRWGYLPQRTSRYGMSGAQYFDDEIFGADATRYSAGPWETAERSQALWQTMFSYAEELGIHMGIGFELYQLPEEIVKAVPAHVRTVLERKVPTDGGGTLTHTFHRVDPTSRAAKYILEARLAQLLETYPSVSYIQLWEDEFTNWISQSEDIETPVEPFKQAHDFLRRHAPDKRLVIAGWGGVVRNFERFHRELPEDIIFSALSDQFGWDPIHENFGKLGDRERWPIPWMEDDPSMWFPQIHASRFEKDLQLAQDLGCTGMVGIHWRHRIVDPVATYMARRSWDNTYTTEQHYTNYAKTQASGERAEKFGEWLHKTDVNRNLVETWSGNMRDDGHYESQEFSGDYSEVFLFKKYDISDDIFDEQQASIDTLHAIFSDVPEDSLEYERLHYWNGQVGFMSPYLRAWQSGRKLENLLDGLFQKRKNGESIDTSMGFTPLAGLMMGTRCGDIDPSILEYLLKKGWTPERLHKELVSNSGFLGVSGLTSDCRGIIEAMEAGNHDAKLAFEVFTYRAAKYIASYMVALDELDGIIFTGGIGENSLPVRREIMRLLKIFGYREDIAANEAARFGAEGVISQPNTPLAIVIPTNEEFVIAQQSLALLNAEA